MDRYTMNRTDMRYRSQRPCSTVSTLPRSCETKSCPPTMPVANADMDHHADQLPLAMAYVPIQRYHSMFEPCKALQMGTVFPELCKPFCGKRGGCK